MTGAALRALARWSRWRSRRRCWPAPARAHEMSHGRDGGARDRARRVPLAVVGRRTTSARWATTCMPHWPEALHGRSRTSCAAAAAGLQGHAGHRRRRQALLGRAGEGRLARRPEPRLHPHQRRSRRCSSTARPTTGAAWARSRAPTRAGRRAHPERHRSPAVRGRPAVPGRLPAPADRHHHRVHAGAQPDPGLQRVRLDHAAPAAGRGRDRAVDRAGGERGAARARHAGAASAGAGVVPVRPGPRPRLRRRAQGASGFRKATCRSPCSASTSASSSASC